MCTLIVYFCAVIIHYFFNYTFFVMQITKTMPTKSKDEVGTRGIIAQIARERNVNANTVYLCLRRRSPEYMKRFVEIYEERKALQARFQQLYKKDGTNG